MKPRKFTKKPVTIQAMQYAGTPAECMAVYKWVEANSQGSYDTNDPMGEIPVSGVSIHAATGLMVISTLEGEMTAQIGDWIIRGVQGEFYPCKPDIFEATYTPTTATVTELDTPHLLLSKPGAIHICTTDDIEQDRTEDPRFAALREVAANLEASGIHYKQNGWITSGQVMCDYAAELTDALEGADL